MALFSNDRAEPSSRSRRRLRAGWTLLTVGIVGALALSFIPSPYVIERPGPVFDTLGEVSVEGETVPLISIPGEETFPTEGTLSMLTVNVVGNRETRPNWFEVITSWGNPSRAVLPLDEVFPPGQSVEQSNEQSAVDMQNSQKDAIAASLIELGYPLEATLTVAGFSPDSPSDGILMEGDEILSVNGEDPLDVTQLRAIIADNGTESPVTVEISRSGAAETVKVTPRENPDGDGNPIVGITVGADYDFPFEVKIQLEKVGGPSAGMMFALGIIDTLTSGFIQGGEDVAGTGTVNQAGEVGQIGGIRQKLIGADRSGADWFLAPADNCDEVTGHVPDGMTVFSVDTLDDALAALDAIRTGSDTDALEQCALG